MQVILTQKIEKLGRKGDVKAVKPGYYRNYLAPNGLAIVVTPARLKWAEGLQAKAVKEIEQVREHANEIKKQLEATPLVIEAKTTSKDTLYGSITEKNLVDIFKEQAKIKLEKKQIEIKEPIKKIGEHKVKIKLTDDVEVEVNIEVKAKETEKKESKKKKSKK